MTPRAIKDQIESEILHVMLSVPRTLPPLEEASAWLGVLRLYLRLQSRRGNWKGGITLDLKQWRHNYAVENRETRRLQKLVWRAANREVREQARRWADLHREQLRFYARHRRYLLRGGIGSHTVEEWEHLRARHGYRCVACRRAEPDIKLTEDHIVPLSRGGTNLISNIQPLCRNCNSRKWTDTIKYEP